MIPREPRQKVVLPARMRCEGGHVDICIRDISTRGMMAQADHPPPRGSYVEILRPACTIVARVVWTRDRKFGIQTRERVVLSAVTERRTVSRANDNGPGAPLDQSPKPCRRRPAHGEASRWLAARFQHGALVACGAAAAITAASVLFQSLAGVAEAVTAGLR